MSVISTHNDSGFFSCCSVKLFNIVNYINNNNNIPTYVDSSQSFEWYKQPDGKDVTYEYFEHYDNLKNITIYNSINYHHEHQYIDYLKLDYSNIIPLVKKYFSPAKGIINIINNIEQKYSLIYDNICVLFYRGNDKITETDLCKYDEYLVYANLILNTNPNILFLIQSDETEFIEFMIKQFPNNSFYFKDEIRHVKKCVSTVDKLMKNTNHEFAKYYLAITIIMSKCKYIICGSGNCSIWIMLYRGNNNNVYQNLNRKWLTQILIYFEEINKMLKSKNINIIGSFHVGAHECEELTFYNKLGLKNDDMIWLEARPKKVSEAQNRGIPNVYNAVITEKDDEEIIFNIANNDKSSSVLKFGSKYPFKLVSRIRFKSITIDTFFERNNIDASKYNFWNFSVEGAELMALKGSTKSIKYAKAICLKVNKEELYKNGALITEIDTFLYKYNFKRVLTYMTPDGCGDALYTCV